MGDFVIDEVKTGCVEDHFMKSVQDDVLTMNK